MENWKLEIGNWKFRRGRRIAYCVLIVACMIGQLAYPATRDEYEIESIQVEIEGIDRIDGLTERQILSRVQSKVGDLFGLETLIEDRKALIDPEQP